MAILPTHTTIASTQPRLASRRHWLKGLGALLGTGLLTAPTSLLAAPVAAPLPASALVGGEEYLGTVKMLASEIIPAGWMRCDGQHLSVEQYPALFALLGTMYGGNGTTTFALPKLHPHAAPATAHASPAAQAPDYPIAIKTANAQATTTALQELRLKHHRRPKTNRPA